jgi:hypothetical protein
MMCASCCLFGRAQNVGVYRPDSVLPSSVGFSPCCAVASSHARLLNDWSCRKRGRSTLSNKAKEEGRERDEFHLLFAGISLHTVATMADNEHDDDLVDYDEEEVRCGHCVQ